MGISKEYEVIRAVMDNGPVLMANIIAADAVPKAMANAAASAEIRQIHELTRSEVKNEFYHQCREYVATKLPRW